VLVPQGPRQLVDVFTADSHATAPVLSADRAGHHAPIGLGRFNRWARLAALVLGPVSAHYYSFLYLFSKFVFRFKTPGNLLKV
jgi:hypothetical protein